MGKIIIFEGQSQYNVLNMFAHNLNNELKKSKESLVIDLRKEYSAHELNNELKNGIDLTIGFNCMGVRDTYIKLGIPHVALLVDHPIYHIDFLDLSKKTLYVGETDKQRVGFMKSVMNFENTFEFNHAVDKNIVPSYENKEYDIIMLGGLTSSNIIRQNLKEKYNKDIFQLIEDVTELAANNSNFTIESLIDSVILEKDFSFNNLSNIQLYRTLLPDIDVYTRSISREKAIKQFSKFNINIFWKL